MFYFQARELRNRQTLLVIFPILIIPICPVDAEVEIVKVTRNLSPRMMVHSPLLIWNRLALLRE